MSEFLELAKENRKILILGGIIGLYVSAFVSVLTFSNRERLLAMDISAYLTGAYIIKNGNIEDLYDPEVQRLSARKVREYEVIGLLSYRNPPIVAYMFIPLLGVPVYTAYKIYFFVQIIVLSLFVFYLLKEFKVPYELLLPACFFIPFFTNILFGQMMGLLFIAFYYIYTSLKEQRSFIPGLLCFFIYLKPQYVLLMPFLFILVKDKVRFLLGAGIAALTFLALNFGVYGKNFLTDYLFFLFKSENLDMGTHLMYSSTLTAYADHFIDYPVIRNKIYAVTLVLTIIIYFGGLILFYLRRNKLSFNVLFFISLVLSMNANLHTMPADLLLFLIPIIYFYKSTDPKLRKLAKVIYLLPLLGLVSMNALLAVINLLIVTYLLIEYPKTNQLVDLVV